MWWWGAWASLQTTAVSLRARNHKAPVVVGNKPHSFKRTHSKTQTSRSKTPNLKLFSSCFLHGLSNKEARNVCNGRKVAKQDGLDQHDGQIWARNEWCHHTDLCGLYHARLVRSLSGDLFRRCWSLRQLVHLWWCCCCWHSSWSGSFSKNKKHIWCVRHILLWCETKAESWWRRSLIRQFKQLIPRVNLVNWRRGLCGTLWSPHTHARCHSRPE